MKITLTQADLNAAIAAYTVNTLGFGANMQVSSKFSLSGKQRDIVTAEVELLPAGQVPKAAEAAPAGHEQSAVFPE